MLVNILGGYIPQVKLLMIQYLEPLLFDNLVHTSPSTKVLL